MSSDRKPDGRSRNTYSPGEGFGGAAWSVTIEGDLSLPTLSRIWCGLLLVVDMIKNQSRLRSTIETSLRDLFGGAISGVVSVVYCVSYGALIFSGPLAPWLGYGIAATFISTTIGALVAALRSSLPFTIAGPDSSTSVVTATLVAAFVEWLVANGATDHVLEPTLVLMALSSVLVGILLCGLGLAGAGRDPLRALPGDWRVPRGDWMANGFRC
jgi:hypothetical protein